VERHRNGARELDALFQAAPIGMARVDASGMVTALNAEFGRMIGVPVPVALHRTLDEIAPSIDGRWREILGTARDTPGLSRRTVTVSAPPDGRSLEVVGWASTEAGEMPGVTLLVSEVPTDRETTSLIETIERARFAREIHDGLAQDLWLAKLTATKLARLPTLDAEGQAMCADLLQAIDAGLTEARTAVMAMRSEPTITLAELIERQVDEFSDRFGIRAECDLPDGHQVPPRIAVEMLGVVQEALNNVRKHACARRVMVRMETRRTSVVLSVRDDGNGFDPAIASVGYGRQSMHERAQSIGARLRIASLPGRGTTVTLRVPVAQLVTQR
jgi:signal transduction histidine kinase